LKGISCKLSIVGVLSKQQEEALRVNQIDYNTAANITNEELKEQYEKADLLAFVSTYEGFGMPIVEAQIVGRPVVTSNLLSMPEVAGDAAHLVDPFDVEDIRKGVLRIIEDKAYRTLLIEKGRSNALRFSVETIANQYAELYREIS
jgi:glycosyltransferase involved in cell wall biosynthesis